MSPKERPRIERLSDGGFRLQLSAEERELLAALPNQVEHILVTMDSSSTAIDETARRLFPPAYVHDEQAEQSFVSSVRDDLIEHHRGALRVLTTTAHATSLEDEELEAWLTALNDIRLVLGTSLAVSEEQIELEVDDPRYAEWVCYHYLSFLLGEVVDALTEVLPPPWHDDDEPMLEDPWGEPPGGLRWDGTDLPEARA